MKKQVEFEKKINKDGKEIVSKIKTTIKTDVKNTNNEEEFKSVFYYKVNKESELFLDAKVDTVVLEITHLSPINYKKFHEELMIESWALEHLGYDMINDQDIWVNKLKTDKEFEKKLGALLDTLIPISKEEYDNYKGEEE